MEPRGLDLSLLGPPGLASGLLATPGLDFEPREASLDGI